MSNRRQLLAASLIAASALSAGCTSIMQKPAPFLSVTDLPRFFPRFPIPFTADWEQMIAVHFIDEAKAGGAPANIPELRTRLLVKPDSLEVALLAMNFPVWRLYLSPTGLRESRHGLLDKRVAAEPFLRDLTFALWPEKDIREMLAESPDADRWSLRVSTNTRRLTAGNLLLLEMKKEGDVITLTNHPEGYTLTITTAPAD